MRRRSQAGVTLMEVLIAVTLLSLLSAGMLVALRMGLSSFTRVDARLMDNRRVAGAQRIVEQQLEGLVPVITPCADQPAKMAFFQGERQTMRLVSTFSLQQAWRGQPQILEIFVIPGDDGRGVRLVANEIPYTGPFAAGQLCQGFAPDPLTGVMVPHFVPVVAGPRSFVLADNLAGCRFTYYTPSTDPKIPFSWQETWAKPGWPLAIRIDMAPLDPDPSRLQPISVVAPIHILRNPETVYAEY
jgi:prepilin-type N-terminal cleavage/methylation domain-containing protein